MLVSLAVDVTTVDDIGTHVGNFQTVSTPRSPIVHATGISARKRMARVSCYIMAYVLAERALSKHT